MTRQANRPTVAVRPDPRLLQAVIGALFLGLIVLSSMPAARGASAWFGSLPLWLLGMPLAALAALHMRALHLRALHRRALHLRSHARATPPAAMRGIRRGRGMLDPQIRRRPSASGWIRLPRVA